MTLPQTGEFRFDVSAEIGWNQPLTSALRRRVPGAAGRNRMRRYLRTEAAGLVHKHIGRARADFQARLARLALDLRTAADQAYGQRQTQLRAALDIARRDHTDTGPSEAAIRQWRELAEQLDQLVPGGQRRGRSSTAAAHLALPAEPTTIPRRSAGPTRQHRGDHLPPAESGVFGHGDGMDAVDDQ